MAIPLGTVPQNFSLQGNTGSSLGVTQGNPLQGASISPSATAPTAPKSTYIQNKASQIAQTPAAPTQVGPSQLTFGNGLSYDSSGNQVGTQQQTSQPIQAPTSQPSYDPYQSPAYQQYLNKYIESQTPGLNNQQIQTGLVGANTDLAGLQQISSNNIQADLQNPNLSQGALTGQMAAEAQVLANRSVPIQTRINLLTKQQEQAGTAANAGLTSAQTEATYLSGLAKPTAISPGQNLAQLNPATGQATSLASQPSFGLGTDISGAPVTYNQNTGAINQPSLNLGGNGSSLNPLNNVGSIAQQVISGQISPSAAYQMGGSVQNWQGLLNQALQQAHPGFDQSSAQAKYDANQSTQTAQKEQVAQMTSSFQSGQNLQAQLKDLITTFGINPNDVNSLNSGLQLIKKNTSSSQYQSLHNYVTDLVSTYANILTPGVSTESTRAKADSLLDPSASGKSMLDTLSSLDQQARAKIAGVPTKSTSDSGSASQVFGWNP